MNTHAQSVTDQDYFLLPLQDQDFEHAEMVWAPESRRNVCDKVDISTAKLNTFNGHKYTEMLSNAAVTFLLCYRNLLGASQDEGQYVVVPQSGPNETPAVGSWAKWRARWSYTLHSCAAIPLAQLQTNITPGGRQAVTTAVGCLLHV